MLRCIKCVMPNTRPDTPFVDGVCGACLNYANRPAIDWDARREALIALLDRFDGKVLVPSSGGKDSTSIVLKLRDLGADVTTVTAMTCMPTEIGLANIANLERFAPCIRVEPDRLVAAKLNRIGLEMVGDISWREHVSIFSQPFQVAVTDGYGLMFYGENPQDWTGGPPGSEQALRMTRRWRSEFGGMLGLRPDDLIGVQGLTAADMHIYQLPADMEKVECYFLGQFLPWSSLENAQLANENGMRQVLPSLSNWWVSENQCNAQTGCHDFFAALKYGYSRAVAQISTDIRTGREGVTRETGLRWITQYEGRFMDKYMGITTDEVLDYIGLTRGQYIAICNQFMNKGLFIEQELTWGQRLTLRN